MHKVWNGMTLPAEVCDLLEAAPSVKVAGSVEELADCDSDSAMRALEAARDIRAATLMVRFGLTADAARMRLDAARGSLRAALEAAE